MIVFLVQQDVTPSATPSAKQPATPDERATEFRAVSQEGEQRSGATLMVEAYCVLWLILMAWIFMIWRKQAGLHVRLDELEKVLDKAAAKAGK